MKRKVVFSESESDSEFEPEKKKKSSHSKRSKLPKTETAGDSDLFDDERNSHGGKVQLSITEALKQASNKKENVQKVKKRNTLDTYFGQKTTVKSAKKEISVDDFFGGSGKKHIPSSSVTVTEGMKTPPRMPTPTVPDTPTVSSDDLIPDTPGVLDKTPSPRKKKASLKSDSDSPNLTPKAPKVAPSTPGTTPSNKSPKQPSTELRSPSNRVPFWAFQSREGPRELGTRVIPKGTSNCLRGKTFLITGILESIEREEAHALIERCGGRVMKTLGKKTVYLIVGREPGPGKLAKAETLNTKKINEDEFFNMISELSNESSTPEKQEPSTPTASGKKGVTSKCSKMHGASLASPEKVKSEKYTESPKKALTAKPVVTKQNQADRSQTNKTAVNIEPPIASTGGELWVDKYRPTSLRTLIGHAGANSPANRLHTWLSSWHEHFSSGAKAKAYSSAPPWATGSSDDGRWARAALLSGLPGIGKTSSALIVCRDLGFTTCELNASDCRSKRSLQEEVSQTLGMQNLKQMAIGESSHLSRDRHVLIMDEVDGMAGNEDRGGMQELISMIKSSRIPVICICNDRQSPKVRSLANYCFDLRFYRPRVEQIKAAVLSIACKENVSIPSSVLTDIIQSSNHDIRQVINNTQMWCVGQMADASQLATDASGARKDVRLSAFDVIRKVFAPDVSGQHSGPASVNECLDLFFQDYSLVPLFVQENYLNVKPKSAQGNVNRTLRLLAEASKHIALGDVVSSAIRSAGTGSWSLLPSQGIFSSVLPGHILSGPLPGGVGPNGGVSFPAWFGKNSNQTRMRRVSSELAAHLNLATHGGSSNPRHLIMDYASILAESLTRPLKEGDTDRVVQSLVQYNLQREDLDALLELTTWSHRPNRMLGIDSKVKAALTRAFNKSTHLLPYSSVTTTKLRSKKAGIQEQDMDELDPNAEDAVGLYDPATPNAQDEDLLEDAMVARKSTKTRSDATSKKTESASASSSKRSKTSTRVRGTVKGSRKKVD